MAQKKTKKCQRANCKKKATVTVDWFFLTGQYTEENKEYQLCRSCYDAILFEREVRRQMREQTADEDELISGDFEE
jgi:hypothetical protein